VNIVPAQMPYLTWRWKVTNCRIARFPPDYYDDQAARLLVAFDDNRVITYIWIPAHPKEGPSRQHDSFLHIFAWSANPAPGCQPLVSEKPQRGGGLCTGLRPACPRVKGLASPDNSQHTGTWRRSYFGEVAFRSIPE